MYIEYIHVFIKHMHRHSRHFYTAKPVRSWLCTPGNFTVLPVWNRGGKIPRLHGVGFLCWQENGLVYYKEYKYSLFCWPLVFYSDKSLIRTVPLRLSRRPHHLSPSSLNLISPNSVSPVRMTHGDSWLIAALSRQRSDTSTQVLEPQSRHIYIRINRLCV